MPLWGSVDNAANSDIAALIQVSSNTANADARTALYNNTTANVFQKSAQGNVIVGQFGVSSGEIQALNESGSGHAQHAGWVLRHEGTGLKAGRVWYETLVAMGSMTGDGSDDTYLPDYKITIRTQPSSANGAGNVNLSVVATSTPSGATLSYTWQRNAGAGWVAVANTAGTYFNNTSPTLIANAAVATGNTFRVLVATAGAVTVTSANAAITTP
jgi:hypothetical protein